MLLVIGLCVLATAGHGLGVFVVSPVLSKPYPGEMLRGARG